METGKAFQLVQRAGSVKGLGVQLQRTERGVAAGAATGVLFELRRVRRAVGAEEKPRRAAGGRLHQRLAVLFALEHRQAVVMRAQAAAEEGVAVVQQVVRGDGGAGKQVALLHVLHGFARGDVLQHDLEFREIAPQGYELLLDEHRLAVEHIDTGVGDLAVHQQRHAGALQRLQRRVGVAQVSHAGVAVGGGTRRVELDGHHPGLLRRHDLARLQPVGEVERHERLKVVARRHGV